MSEIRPLGPEIEHYWLVQRMAKQTGVDLVAAMQAGIIDQTQWAGIVTHCRSCDWAEGCHQWLDTAEAEDTELPKPCVNRDTLAGIQAALKT